MNRALPALACFAVVLLAGCNREQPAAPAIEQPTAAVAPAADPVGETDAIAAEPTAIPSSEAPAFDQRAFAGTFSADTNRLELRPDGAYAMTMGDATTDGTWTAEENDSRIRLDPNSKSEPDRVFAMTSRDELTALGPDGQPAVDADAMSLRRETN